MTNQTFVRTTVVVREVRAVQALVAVVAVEGQLPEQRLVRVLMVVHDLYRIHCEFVFAIG
jgi:hypothetical protein